jgi:porin
MWKLLPFNLFLTAFGLSLLSLQADSPSQEQTAAQKLKAGDPLTTWLTQDYMLGDWGGQRPKLSQKGVDFEFLYFSAVPTNLGGGLNTGSVYEGALLATFDLDFEKLADFHGGRFHASGLWIHGQNFSRNFIGDNNVVSLIDLTESCRLWELWYEQKIWQDKISIKFGQLSIDRDFVMPELYSTMGSINFLNQTFFYPTMAFNVYDRPFFPVENHALASTPYATPGIRVRFDPIPEFYVQAAVYGGNPDRTYNGTRFNLSEDAGALSYFEMGYRHRMKPGDQGLPGSYKIGGYYHTDNYSANEVLLSVFGLPNGGVTYDGNYGIYALGEQTLYREVGPEDPAQQGLIGFVRGCYAPPDRNLYEWSVDGGLVYRGAIPGRDFDTLGLAGSYMAVSDDIRRVQGIINNFAPGSLPKGDYEAVIELNYKAQLAAWMTLQTSVQRVFHPGGHLAEEIPDAWVLIVQTGLRF